MNPLFLMLHALATLITESLPDMAERLPAATVQKFRDALQELEQINANTDEAPDLTGSGDPYEPTLPPMLQDLLDRALEELDRRKEYDAANAAISARSAIALERIGEMMAALGRPDGK